MQYADFGHGQGSHEREERISPREGEMIKYRDTRTQLTFQLLTGEIVEGSVRWYDSISCHVVRPDRTEITLFYHALSFYQVKGQAPQTAAQ